MYKLVFYSDQILPEGKEMDEHMLELLGMKQPVVGYISSASDPERKWFLERQKYYSQYNIDLNFYFDLEQAYDLNKLDDLFSCDAIHLSGGNTYHFLQRLKARKLLQPLREYASNGGILIGVSAGAILMTPDISTTFLCGNVRMKGMDDTASLGLVDFAFVPHFEQPESRLPELIAYSQEYQTTVYGCPDGAGIIVDGDQIEFIGNIVSVKNGVVE